MADGSCASVGIVIVDIMTNRTTRYNGILSNHSSNHIISRMYSTRIIHGIYSFRVGLLRLLSGIKNKLSLLPAMHEKINK